MSERSRSAITRLASRGRRIVDDRFLKKWGSASQKKVLWDAQYASGLWDYLDHTVDDPVYRHLEKYSNHGSILDLGCGSSNTGNEMKVSWYGTYTGVDISEEAIQRAMARALGNGRQYKNEYFCADIISYVPRISYDIILFRESLFYVPVSKIKGTLDRYAEHLRESGVFIVRMCDEKKYRSIVRLIERCYPVLERSSLHDSNIIQVFRGRPEANRRTVPHGEAKI